MLEEEEEELVEEDEDDFDDFKEENAEEFRNENGEYDFSSLNLKDFEVGDIDGGDFDGLGEENGFIDDFADVGDDGINIYDDEDYFGGNYQDNEIG